MTTTEEILNRMLAGIPDTLDKRKGSVIYLALAPVAEELALKITEVEKTYEQTFADTATGDSLTKRAAERGISRKQATYAIRKGTFNIIVPIGSRFGIESTTYIVIENLAANTSKLKCEQAGEIGNVYTGDMLPITYIEGLETARLADILIPGEDIETDGSLRNRYYENLDSQAFGGNKADYKQKVKSLAGVSGVKVYPIWNGGGTVKIVLIDSTFGKPSTELINNVQAAIDPISNSGKGLGLAPIGHKVTVSAVEELTVNIVSNITLVAGYLWNDVKPHIENVIKAYFLELKKTWDNEANLVVRISQIESAILKVTGVLDIQTTKLNGSVTNLILTDVQIPILGTVAQA